MAILAAPAFASATVAGMTVKTTSESSVVSTGTDSVASVSIASNTELVNNKKFIAGVEVTTAYSDVAATLVYQVSHNGTEWADYATMSSDITPNVDEVKVFVVDTTNLYAPYHRIHFNPTGQNIGTSGKLKFFYAFS